MQLLMPRICAQQQHASRDERKKTDEISSRWAAKPIPPKLACGTVRGWPIELRQGGETIPNQGSQALIIQQTCRGIASRYLGTFLSQELRRLTSCRRYSPTRPTSANGNASTGRPRGPFCGPFTPDLKPAWRRRRPGHPAMLAAFRGRQRRPERSENEIEGRHRERDSV